MDPTNLYYLSWSPKIQAKADSPYFESEGATILINTVPVLFVAVMGCVYLHLGKLSNFNYKKGIDPQSWLAICRKQMIIRGLGIVSLTELAFVVMFIGLLAWCFSSYLHTTFPGITPQAAAQMGMKVWEAKLKYAGVFLGLTGNVGLAFVLFPVSRGSSLLPTFGVTSEASIKYHIWLGHTVMALFTAHGLCYIVFWAATYQLSEMSKWAKSNISNVAGEISLVAGLLMWVTTIPRIRRKMFEVFFYTHHLYIIFVVFFVFHVGISSAFIMLPGFYLFMVDRYLRFLQSRQGVRLVSARVLPCEAIELNFSKSKGLVYKPTSTIFVNIPSISRLQWHPFTIISSSSLEPEKLSVMIKGEGKWTKTLYQMLSSPPSIERLQASLEGPYGPTSTDFARHDKIVMISGGSGITPFISIIRDFIYMNVTMKCEIPKIILITVFKNSPDLSILDLILPIAGPLSNFAELDIQIQAYITREKAPPTNEQHKINNLHSVWFKPKPSDVPISPILGQNNWLWLGAIISSSFVMFLLLVGILTRYYIYPIDHNQSGKYSYSARDALNMLFICISIVITASSAFMWNKRKDAMETRQVLNLEKASPLANSPIAGFYNEERELDSLPNQSIIPFTNVHYGQRPDLKKILFELKESSVGVLVCGPKKMRHEAARICSSGLVSNLHYESISFSW
ncbi:hypothetical protein Leryth_000097 [Lithospermum erythrorhizon]|nr:hypothetical protein Leryth_000097 [Lithospermum erythrorhizon]